MIGVWDPYHPWGMVYLPTSKPIKISEMYIGKYTMDHTWILSVWQCSDLFCIQMGLFEFLLVLLTVANMTRRMVHI